MFISFEGGEGTGKTTLIQIIKQTLEDKGYEVVLTREPGGTGSMLAEEIRDLVLNPKFTHVNEYTEALLYAASRAQHLDEVIIPALESKKIVLCDRYLDSSLAYQAFARNLGLDFILEINKYATKHLPDITFYIDIDPLVGIERIKGRSKFDRLDREKIAFHNEVRKGYLELTKMFSERIIKIEGEQTIPEISIFMIDEINKRL
ncbi:dTMP kinase [Haploplasma axanthum]|nr:dTMP kinase [Haploplasma axanthum]